MSESGAPGVPGGGFRSKLALEPAQQLVVLARVDVDVPGLDRRR